MSDISMLMKRGCQKSYDPSHSTPDQRRAEHVIKAVCTHHGVDRAKLLSRCKKAEIVRARWSAMMMLREVECWSLPRIAGVLNRDHTTVLVGLRRAHEHMSIDAAYRDAVARVRDVATGMKRRG